MEWPRRCQLGTGGKKKRLTWLRWWAATEGRVSAASCRGCRRIRRQNTWCPTCTAPEVLSDNVLIIDLFLASLPAWREDGPLAGFARAEIQAEFSLRALPVSDWPALWLALREMEAEYRTLRHEQRAPAATTTTGLSAGRILLGSQ